MNHFSSGGFATLIAILIFIILRVVSLRTIRGWKFRSADVKRKWIVGAKNLHLLLLFIGLILIWATEIRELAFSLVAIAAALAISLKEWILCLMGGLYKASTQQFDIGDRISLQGFRGEVVDHTFFSTSLFEIGPGEKTNQYTGKIIRFPNSLLLSEMIVLEPAGKHFSLHSFHIPFRRDRHWKRRAEILLKTAMNVSSDYFDIAQEYLEKLNQKEGLEPPNLEPRVNYSFPDKDTIEYFVRLPVPFDSKIRIEQMVTDQSLAEMSELS